MSFELKRGLGQGNVFTPVCHSVHGVGGGAVQEEGGAMKGCCERGVVKGVVLCRGLALNRGWCSEGGAVKKEWDCEGGCCPGGAVHNRKWHHNTSPLDSTNSPVNKWTIHILLECFLVLHIYEMKMKSQIHITFV